MYLISVDVATLLNTQNVKILKRVIPFNELTDIQIPLHPISTQGRRSKLFCSFVVSFRYRAAFEAVRLKRDAAYKRVLIFGIALGGGIRDKTDSILFFPPTHFDYAECVYKRKRSRKGGISSSMGYGV
ncbi:hypothetical protein EVAR_27267_1 [Eumeta japonica]|uniref:Uncharacterized protein n=1 Tax=Eumeta variegata TaxID=151549 RepID=A0A4C1W0C9_EUMVA|nr:hypothetical protein EVAR_27267_1 [Eumeta japonica]